MLNKTTLDYLVIGHVVQDVQPDGGLTYGGTATYAARTALALGCRVRVITSTAADLDLETVLGGCDVIRVPSDKTSTFENIYTPSGRQQYLYARAASLTLDAVPSRWRTPDIVHIAPLTGEADPALVTAFPHTLVGVTPQGWMRSWDNTGRVFFNNWRAILDLLPHVDAAVMSLEDVEGDERIVQQFADLAPVLVVTLGRRGCRVYRSGKNRHVPVTPVEELDPTGAGDIFAAVFLVRFRQTGDPVQAAYLANQVAALSVGRVGWTATPTVEEIAALVKP
jgi:sugar/nucleoside kinase (ribokinase family)